MNDSSHIDLDVPSCCAFLNLSIVKQEPLDNNERDVLDPNLETDHEDNDDEGSSANALGWIGGDFAPDTGQLVPPSAPETILPEENPVYLASLKSAPDAERAFAKAGSSKVTKSTGSAGLHGPGPKSKTRVTSSKRMKEALAKVSSGPSPNKPPPSKRPRFRSTTAQPKANQARKSHHNPENEAILPELSPDKVSDSKIISGSTDDEMGDQDDNQPPGPSSPPPAATSFLSPEKRPEKSFRQLLIDHIESNPRIKHSNPSKFMEGIETPQGGDQEDFLAWIKKFPHTYSAVAKKPNGPLTKLQEALYSRIFADCDRIAYSYEDPMSGEKIKWVGYYYAHGVAPAETPKDIEEYTRSLKDILLQDLENERSHMPFSERELRPKFAEKIKNILAGSFNAPCSEFNSKIGAINLRSRFLASLDQRFDLSVQRETLQWIDCRIRLGPDGDLEVLCPRAEEFNRENLLSHGLNIRMNDEASQSFISLITGFAKDSLTRDGLTASSSLPFGDLCAFPLPILVICPIFNRDTKFKAIRSRCDSVAEVSGQCQLIPGLLKHFHLSLCIVQSTTAENIIFEQIQKPFLTIQPEQRTPFNIVQPDFKCLGPTQRKIILFLLSAVSSKIGSDILVVDHSRTESLPNSHLFVYDLLFIHIIRYFICWKHELRTFTWPDYKPPQSSASDSNKFFSSFEEKINMHFTLINDDAITTEWKRNNKEVKLRATEPLKLLIIGDKEASLIITCHLLLDVGEKVFYSNPREPNNVISLCLSKMTARPDLKDPEYDELCTQRDDLARNINNENINQQIHQFLSSLCKHCNHCVGLLDDVLMDSIVYQHFKDHPFSICFVSGVESLTDAQISCLMKFKFSKLIVLGDMSDLQSHREKNIAYRMLDQYSSLYSQLDSVTQAPVISSNFQVYKRTRTFDRFSSIGDTNSIHGNRHSTSSTEASPGMFKPDFSSSRNANSPLIRNRPFTIPKVNRKK